MTEERPPDDLEPTQAQLELDDPAPIAPTAQTGLTNGHSKPPDDAPPEDPPPDYPLPEDGPPPETANALDATDARDEVDDPERDALASEDEEPTALDSEPEPALEFESEPENDLDEPSDAETDEQPVGPGSLLRRAAAAAAAATTRTPSPLPTSWPDPPPVASPEVSTSPLEGMRITPAIVILGGLVTLSFLMFIAIEPTPRWLLLFTAIIAILGTDGALRQAWPRPFGRSGSDADTTPYLFLPALAVIAWPMLIEHNIGGYLAVPAALLAGLAFVATITAQVSSVRVTAPVHPYARLVSTAAVYFSAFALFSLSYVLDVGLPASIAAVAVVAAMLSVELFREGEVDPVETLVFAGVTGIILGEARWAMYYVPVGGYLGGLALLLGFFLVTGLLHSHLTRRLNNVVALEYGGLAAAGVLLVAVAAQAGLG